MIGIQMSSTTPTLAMIGLRQVGQFEICRESLSHLVRVLQIELANDRLRASKKLRIEGLFRIAPNRLAVLNEQMPKLFHQAEHLRPRLLHQDLSQDGAE